MQDLTVDQYSTLMDQHSTTHIEVPHWPSRHHPGCNFREPTSFLHSKWSFLYSLMSACQKLWTCSPIKKILNKIGNSCQSYVNYYKTHAMATLYRGIGKPLENYSDPQDTNANIRDEYQADINDLENTEPDHQAGLRDLSHEIEQLWQTIETTDNDPMDAISHLECKHNQLVLTLHLPMPSEPTEEVLHQYTNTLCNAQKKMSFVNSLLQNITILDGNDSSQLEDWLTEIKTASDLTGKSRTKLAQAKSKGLIRTLISEALTSIKTWDEIKDPLHLKNCNSDIHTSVNHFMEIQQKEKESLAAYIHCFKREASRCKFNNDATTIRIFIKGFGNVHTLQQEFMRRDHKA